MCILVTGKHGQVGNALERQGREQNLDLVALGRSELNITDATSIEAAFNTYQPDLLINAAAYTAVEKAESDAELAYAVNENGTALLADACNKAKIPMLHISTDYVFDGSKIGLYSENDPVNPLAIYAKSKEAGERALRQRLKDHIILRTSWVFGTQGENFVKKIVRLAKERERLDVVEDQFGGPSSARGIAEVLLKIAAQYGNGHAVAWGTYHYCQKPYVSWYKFARIIVERAIEIGLLDRGVEIIPVSSSKFPTPVRRPMNSRLDTTKLNSTVSAAFVNWITEVDYILNCIKFDDVSKSNGD